MFKILKKNLSVRMYNFFFSYSSFLTKKEFNVSKKTKPAISTCHLQTQIFTPETSLKRICTLLVGQCD